MLLVAAESDPQAILTAASEGAPPLIEVLAARKILK
jgi:hypothetical protein